MEMTEHEPEVVSASEAAERDNPDADVRRWLLEEQVGTLSTTMARHGLAGFPYASVVPYALTADGRPFILIARIATHTQNLVADPRASLFVRQPGLEGDPQKGWRITVMGEWEQVAKDTPEHEELHARYVERLPWADGYLATHDFSYWRMKAIQTVRYIGGFGKITWVKGELAHRDPLGGGIGEAAPGAIEHMNEDHRHNLLEMLAGRYGVEAEDAEMVSLDRTGFLVRAHNPDGLHHFSFGEVIDAERLRPAVIEVLQRCRKLRSA